jgi:hypothetical protein
MIKKIIFIGALAMLLSSCNGEEKLFSTPEDTISRTECFSMMHDNLYLASGGNSIRNATLDIPVATFATYGAWARSVIPW